VPRRDYYAILGVKRSASQEDIKRAFRGLAKEYHPDKNPLDLDAETRFREIVEAYECLSDPTERSRYHKIGPLYRPDGKPPSTDDINNLVSDAVQTLFRRDKVDRRGEDLRYQLELRLEEVGSGSERTIEIERLAACERCSGDGAEPDGGKKLCDACGGSGKSQTRRLFRSDCPRCDGRGFTIVKRCVRCDGKGRADHRESIKVKVPAGVATGQKLKVRGKGNVGERGGPAGDLFVLVHVEDHALFQRRGADLICDVPLLLQEAALGVELVVPTLDGTTTIRIPPGTPSGKVFRLSGRGLPKLDGARNGKATRGDLHLRTAIEVPASVDPSGKAALESLGSRLGTEAYPLRKAFDAELRKRP
jgi:molecular chaperone DnaJ